MTTEIPSDMATGLPDGGAGAIWQASDGEGLGGEIRYDEPWNRSLFRPLLITILVLCLDVALISVLRRFMVTTPGATFNIFLAAAGLAALIGCYTTTVLVDPGRRTMRTTGYRLAELGTILLFLRMALWTFATGWPQVESMLLFPVTTLMDGVFLAALVVVGLSWGMANNFTALFLEMALRPDELQGLEESQRNSREVSSAASRWIRSDRAEVLNRFAGRWIGGGALIVLLAASSQVGAGQNGFFAILRQNIAASIILAAIVYFIGGLILLGQGRLATLRARWALEGIENPREMMRTWPLYVLGLVFLVAVLASLLPMGGTFWLARIIMTILAALQFAAMFFLNLLFYFISLFAGEGEETILETPAPTFEKFPTPAPAALAESGVPPWLGGIFFWVVTALLLGYAAYIYLQGKGVRFTWLAQLWQQLRKFWADLFKDLRRWQRMAAQMGSQEEDAGATPAASLVARFRRLLGQMTPEQQVRYYYLDTLEQADAHGMARRAGETPLAYSPRLQAQLAMERPADQPVEGVDGAAVQELTEAFVQVRYGTRPVGNDDASRLKRMWTQLRKLLT